jgi:DNA-binding MarR family transcriptional regulator
MTARTQTTMEELVSHMFIMGRLMRDKMHKKANNGQCTLLEFETLKYVKDAGRPHMRDVAKNFHVTPPAATLLIDALVKARLLARVLDPKDRRAVRVAITPKGRQLLDRGITNKVREMKKIFGVLTPAERTHFVAALKKIIKNNS